MDLSSMVIGKELIDTVDAKHAAWLQEHVGRATASSAKRLTAGMLRTPEEKLASLKSMLKSDIKELAERVGESSEGTIAVIAERIVNKVPDQIPQGLITYAEECAVETMTNQPIREEFFTKDTIRGHEKEVETAKEFTKYTGIEIQKYGDDQEFIKPNRRMKIPGHGWVNLMDHVGCTPDGIIGIDAGFEGKARSSMQHWKRLKEIWKQEDLLKPMSLEVYWQIMFSMWVTGRKSWFLAMYDDRFTAEFAHLRLRIVRVDRNEKHIKLLEERIRIFIKIKLDTIEEARKMAA